MISSSSIPCSVACTSNLYVLIDRYITRRQGNAYDLPQLEIFRKSLISHRSPTPTPPQPPPTAPAPAQAPAVSTTTHSPTRPRALLPDGSKIDFKHNYYKDLGVEPNVRTDSINRGFKSKGLSCLDNPCLPSAPPIPLARTHLPHKPPLSPLQKRKCSTHIS